MPVPRVVVVDHHDSYTWNLVHLVAAVTGVLPVVVEHDEVGADALLDKGFSHIVLSPGPAAPTTSTTSPSAATCSCGPRCRCSGCASACRASSPCTAARSARSSRRTARSLSCEHHGGGVFEGVPSPFEAVRYHSLAAVALPAVLEETAWCEGDDGRVVMGVAHREKPLWGVQFHPESILTQHGERLLRNFLEQA